MEIPKSIRSFFDFDWLSEKEFCLYLGHLGMLFFVVFSLVFFKERMLLIDSSYYTYNVIHTEDFFIAHYRYINYFNQWLPLLLMKMGVGLKGVIMGYSLAFVLFYYAIFAIVGYVMKNPKVALFLVVTLVLSCRFKHFMAVTETTNTLALSFLFIGWVTRDAFMIMKNRPKEIGIAVLCLALLQIGHPIIFLPLVSFTAFYLVFYRQMKNPYAWLTLGLVLLAMLVRYKVMPSSGYEQNKLAAIEQAPETLKTFFDQWTYNHLKDYTLKQFKYGYYLYLIGLIGLLYMRRFLAALVSVGTLICFVVVVVVIYHKGESINMLESYYTYFGYFWGFTLLAVFSELKAPKWVRYLPIVLILLISCRSIWRHGEFFTNRLAYLHELNERGKKHNTTKLLFPKKWMEWNTVIVPWSTSMTTLLYSALEDPNDIRTVYLYSPEELPKFDLQDSTLFLGPSFNLEQFKTEDMPKRYFSLPDDKYHLVK